MRLYLQKPGGKDWAPLWPGYPVPGSIGGLQDVPVRCMEEEGRGGRRALALLLVVAQ